MPELVQAALHAQVRQPILAVGRTTSHSAQQAVIDFDDLLNRLRGDPVTCRRTRVGCHDDATLKSECECRRAVGDLDRA